MMSYKILMKKRRDQEERTRGALQILTNLVKQYDRSDHICPPVQFVKDNLSPHLLKTNRHFPGDPLGLIQVFLEYMRFRPFANKLAGAYTGLFRKVRRYPVASPQTASVMMYILTGYLHPSNEKYLNGFVEAMDFEELAGIIYALDQMKHINRFYYSQLLKKNLFTIELVDQWYYKDKRHPGYSTKYLDGIKKAYISKYGRWIVSGTGTLPTIIKNPKPILDYLYDMFLLKWQENRRKRLKHNRSRQSIGLSLSSLDYSMFSCSSSQMNAEVSKVASVPSVKSDFSAVESVNKQKKYKIEYRDTDTIHPLNKPMPPSVAISEEFKYKYFDPTEEPDFTPAKIEEEERRNEWERKTIRRETRTYKTDVDRMVKKRVVYKNDETVGDVVKGKQPLTDVRTNTATLLKEVSVILKEEEEENKKLLSLLVGSHNYLEYERMIEERIAEEKELFRLKVERLHTEGKLTEKAAVLAKLRLQHESKERRKEFEEERNRLLEDMERLKEIQRDYIMSLVNKVKEINDRVQSQKQNMLEKKKSDVQSITREMQKILKETMAKEKEELQKKILMIKEVRAFQAFRKSLQKEGLGKPKIKEAPKIGLLCEMSLEELASRKELMKTLIKEQTMERRQEILNSIRMKEYKLDQAEEFIRRFRQNKFQKGMSKKLKAQSEMLTFDSINGKSEKSSSKKRKEVSEEKAKKISNIIAKEDADIYNKSLENKITNEQNTVLLKDNFLFRNLTGLRNGDKINSQFDDTLGIKVFITKRTYNKDSTKIQTRRKVDEGKQYEDSTLWGRFKSHIIQETAYNIPDSLMRIPSPPKIWRTLSRKLKAKSKVQSYDQVSTRSIAPSYWRTSEPLRARRHFGYWKKADDRKTLVRNTQWLLRWKVFKQRHKHEEHRRKLMKLQEDHMERLKQKLDYYNGLADSKETEKVEPTVKPSVKKCQDVLLKLQTDFVIMTDEINRAKRGGKYLGKAFKQKKNQYKEPPLRKKLVLPDGDNNIAIRENIRKYVPVEKYYYVSSEILKEEDDAIQETKLTLKQIGEPKVYDWMKQKNLDEAKEKHYASEFEERDSVIKTWEIPIVKKRREKKRENTPQDLPLEVKILRKYGDKYTLLMNKYGLPVFTLRPMKSNPLKWEWVPILTRKIQNVSFRERAEISEEIKEKAAIVEPTESPEKIKKLNAVLLNYIKKNNEKHNLLPKMLAANLHEEDKYLRSLRGKKRREYFMNVPIKMILDYWQTHPYGGDPNINNTKK